MTSRKSFKEKLQGKALKDSFYKRGEEVFFWRVGRLGKLTWTKTSVFFNIVQMGGGGVKPMLKKKGANQTNPNLPFRC